MSHNGRKIEWMGRHGSKWKIQRSMNIDSAFNSLFERDWRLFLASETEKLPKDAL